MQQVWRISLALASGLQSLAIVQAAGQASDGRQAARRARQRWRMSAIRGREHTHFPLKISTNCCLLIFPLLSLSLSDMSFLTSSFRGSNPRDRSATSKSPASICPAQCGFRRAQRQHHAHAHTHARTHKYAHKAPAREPSSASAGRECQQHNISPDPSVSRISKASSISFFCAPIAQHVSGSVRCLRARAEGPMVLPSTGGKTGEHWAPHTAQKAICAR